MEHVPSKTSNTGFERSGKGVVDLAVFTDDSLHIRTVFRLLNRSKSFEEDSGKVMEQLGQCLHNLTLLDHLRVPDSAVV